MKSVMLGGSRREEFLEGIGLKKDDDPVFQVDYLNHIDDYIYLSVPKDSLKTILDPQVFEGYHKLSITKLLVIDANGFEIGNVIDVWFDDADELWLILGGGFIEETLKNLAFNQTLIFSSHNMRLKNNWPG